MAVNVGQPRRLTDGSQPFWSRNGNWIYFVSDPDGSPQIWKISPVGGQPAQLTRNGGVLPMESPDGKFVYFAKDMSCRSLWRIPVAGGEEAHVLDIQGAWSRYTLAGDGIYYLAGMLNQARTSPKASIEFFRPASGARKHIASIEKPVDEPLSVSPDGQFLLYTRQDRETNELMLVENFR
jgi:Tol biopolymer transport system component